MDTLKSQITMWFVAAWYGATTTALIFSVIFSVYLSTAKIIKLNPLAGGQNFKLYAAIPENESYIADDIDYTDARTKIIENFLEGYKSPLAAQSSTFVQVADKYNLDYRLLPSIAMQESNGGKRVISRSYNPFGYGIYGGLVIKFNSWDEAIERVGKALREDYLNQGLKTPHQIMAKYTPPSLAKGGAWAMGVSTFMEELR